MTLDETAASYGLFQIAYAALDQGITDSLVAFLRAKNEKLAFGLVAQIQFGRRVDALQALTRTLDQDSEYVQHLRRALGSAKTICEWRNARVHPRVQFLDGIRPVLMGKDGEPLQIEAAVCKEKIQECCLALSELGVYTDRLVSDMGIVEDMMSVEIE